MKKLAVSSAIALACAGAWASEATSHAHEATHEGGWEMGLAAGRDYGEHRNLFAISAAAPLGAGFKGVFEIAQGRSANIAELEGSETVMKHEKGTTVLTLKAAKEIFSLGHAEFGLSAGLAHMSAETRSGNGLVGGIEMSYPVSQQLAAKVEALRFFGKGGISDIHSNVVQAGIVYSLH